jgi:hypothetical protein
LLVCLAGFVSSDKRHQGLVSAREFQLVGASHLLGNLVATQCFFGPALLPCGLGLFKQPIERDPSSGIVSLDRRSSTSDGR